MLHILLVLALKDADSFVLNRIEGVKIRISGAECIDGHFRLPEGCIVIIAKP